jgi:hypothetical protein
MKKGYYIVLTHSYHAMPTNPGKHTVNEKCEFVTYVKDRHLVNATVIMDMVEQKLVKSRVENATFDKFVNHVEKTHPEYQEFKKLLKEAHPDLYKGFADKEVSVTEDGEVNVE